VPPVRPRLKCDATEDRQRTEPRAIWLRPNPYRTAVGSASTRRGARAEHGISKYSRFRYARTAGASASGGRSPVALIQSAMKHLSHTLRWLYPSSTVLDIWSLSMNDLCNAKMPKDLVITGFSLKGLWQVIPKRRPQLSRSKVSCYPANEKPVH
jgi:hypothetical protein